MREGRERRIEGDYPSEVQPLVNDLNALLEDREQRVICARAMAGDLAHGLKTPLAELSQEAERVAVSGDPELGCSLSQQLERHAAAVQRVDLDEMLGNLLDNAYKWARKRVAVHASTLEGLVELTVDDDGPGLDPALRDKVLERGVRADEAAPGSGLGLAIVRDLAEVYGGSIALGRSPEGGVRARLRLPAVTRATEPRTP